MTRIGLGCAGLGGMYGDIPDEQAVQVVRRAMGAGINLFDTAPLYGLGKSERRLGLALAAVPRDSYVLATKVGRLLKPADGTGTDSSTFGPSDMRAVFDFSYDGVMRSFEESLERLRVGRIDILHIHDPDLHFDQAVSGAYRALDCLRAQGVVSGVGVGMNQWPLLVRFARAGAFDCFLLAGRYSLLEQEALDELLPLCLQQGISILAGGTYNSGILATGARSGARYNYREAPPDILARARRIEEIAARHGVDVRAAASQFVLAHPAVAAIIPGTRRPERVDENVGLLRQSIPLAFWAELKAEGIVRNDAPVPSGR